MKDFARAAAALHAASMINTPLPGDSKPYKRKASGKDRSKEKAARKQSRKARKSK